MGNRISQQVLDSPLEVSYYVEQNVHNGNHLKTYYINLDHRSDRRQEIEPELMRMNLSFTRVPAIKHDIGVLGCTQSHIKTLKQGIASGADHILVFEDDFYFTMDDASSLHQLLQHVMQTNYDVFLLGYCYLDKKNMFATSDKLLKKVFQAACTHGYMVNKNYAKKLLQNFKIGFLENANRQKPTPVDEHWKLLQNDDLWLCNASGPCGLQREGFSDIDNELKWDIKTKDHLF